MSIVEGIQKKLPQIFRKERFQQALKHFTHNCGMSYLPAVSWRSRSNAYVHLQLYMKERHRAAVSEIVRRFDEKIAEDDYFKRSFSRAGPNPQFDPNMIGQIYNSNFGLHVSLTDTIEFNNKPYDSASNFFTELRKISQYSKYSPTSNNRHFEALTELMGGPLRITYKPRLSLVQEKEGHKLFLGLLTSDETNQKLELLMNFIGSLIRDENKYKISVNKYKAQKVSKLHSSLAVCTTMGKFEYKNCKAFNENSLSKSEYAVDEELLAELDFETSFLTASKDSRSLIRIPLPRLTTL